MFKKILIANRGEIACRVAATARRMGIRTVAVYSEADAKAKHVQACDEAVCISEAPNLNAPKQSYLREDAILRAAITLGAEAIHPGYGFLSENEGFAQACADKGIVFIGPPPSAIKAMGLKAESKQLMERAKVPLVPGYHGADQSPALLKKEAERIGFPVLIKASAGGGGKGMRAVNSAAEFDEALASCKREAISSFGDDAVLIERYVQRPRHIEIQVFFDAHGNGVYLFERDCSVQRRHQKVLEEAPAPGMSPKRRQQMGEAAVAAARSVGYVGAGTVEFICEQDGKFYFMEMNTRLQVEHPVTEMITGLDLVEWQLRVAAGERLPLLQDELRIKGHAIEVRICAENPDNNFLPATGTLQVFRMPEHVSFTQTEPRLARIDAGVRELDTISPFYDSMIAKLIVWGEDRAAALAKLDAALAETHIVGLHTNVAFLRRTAQSKSFTTGELDTALIERESAVLFHQQPLSDAWLGAAAACYLMHAEKAQVTHDPWSARDGWRMNAQLARAFKFSKISSKADSASEDILLTVTYDLRAYYARIGINTEQSMYYSALATNSFEITLGQETKRMHVYATGEEFHVFAAEGSGVIMLNDALAHAGEEHGHAGGLTAPMPGKVIALLAKKGDAVKKGQPLAVMEAMKMEHTIAAPADGVVEELMHAVGDQVTEGAALVRFAA
jgi:3-methylcrotonyl-CoA carboxylase alpha subunit